jgi:hypothetical protein
MMKYRKLRIAWTAFFSVVAILLCALLVRSYWRSDSFEEYRGAGMYRSADRINLYSTCGSLGLFRWTFSEDINVGDWAYESDEVEADDIEIHLNHFVWQQDGNLLTVRLPIWSIIAACIFVAVLPWFSSLPRRYSLRTLLVATALIAVALGTIVWLTPQ